MVYPTISILTSGAIVAALLLAADWYVWGRTYATNFRQPCPVKPQASADLVEGVLVRLIASAETCVPRTEGAASTVTATGTATHDGEHGFKQVA
jgi:hypothetical protein